MLCKLIVLTSPREGREQEYNDWYDNRHLDDVLDVPGFVSAQRFKLKGRPLSAAAWQYLAIYEIDHDDPQAVLDELLARAGTDCMPMTDAMDPDRYNVCYEPITPLRKARR